jgi:hypothetical protein
MTLTLRPLLAAAVGAAILAVMVVLRGSDLAVAWPAGSTLLTALVLLPLALELLVERNDPAAVARQLDRARRGQLPAAVAMAVAFYLPAGPVAGLLVLPWFLVAVLLAVVAVRRIARHGGARPLDRLVTDAALLWLAAGAACALAERLGVAPALATAAAHFHQQGFALLLLTALVARRDPESRGLARVLVALVLAIPGVAVGHMVARLGGGPAVLQAAGVGLGVAAFVVAVLHVRLAGAAGLSLWGRAGFAVAGVSLALGVVVETFAIVRGGLVAGPWFSPLLQGVGFGLIGLLAWRDARASGTV